MAPKQPSRLRVITLANPKGGVGKTTICSALAVRAAEESRRVALLDLDPQESLASWWTRRGKTKNPKLFEVDAAVEGIELLISEGWDWVFIDTGPARIDLIASGVAVSDLVLIPTRPSAFDIEQAALCVELCESHRKPHAFVLNHAPSGAKLTKSSVKFLQQAIVAGVFELCLVGVMVIYELLGHTGGGQAVAKIALGADCSIAKAKRVVSHPVRRSGARAKRDLLVGSVKTFVHDRMFPADGERIDVKALTADYRAWCAQKGIAALELDRFLDEIEAVCRRAGIAIEVGDDKRVYCLDVRLEHVPAEPARVH